MGYPPRGLRDQPTYLAPAGRSPYPPTYCAVQVNEQSCKFSPPQRSDARCVNAVFEMLSRRGT
eukprot:795022-Prymnesium_polylepis.1